jgi:two-component system phosphate regulon sensor histidine kinase PhoR
VLTDASDKTAEVLDSRYRASLFPNDIDGPDHFLAVYFPHQSTYILREIATTLIASLIFIGIILGSFIYTMKVIGRQKKLSDIKTDFINNMTHELKTPIATISLATQVLSEKDIGNDHESRNKYLRVIRDENDRLAQQVERVLQSSLMENNELALRMERESMHVLLTEILSTFKTMNSDCLIERNLEAAEDTIVMDVHHMQNVINNLLDNARKYSSPGCSIQVRTWNEDDSLKISVADNGIGMEAKQLQHIFDSFYRIPTGNRHDVKGFGLGLSYVKRIVDLHAGSVYVKSTPGKGSEFTIILPYGE